MFAALILFYFLLYEINVNFKRLWLSKADFECFWAWGVNDNLKLEELYRLFNEMRIRSCSIFQSK